MGNDVKLINKGTYASFWEDFLNSLNFDFVCEETEDSEAEIFVQYVKAAINYYESDFTKTTFKGMCSVMFYFCVDYVDNHTPLWEQMDVKMGESNVIITNNPYKMQVAAEKLQQQLFNILSRYYRQTCQLSTVDGFWFGLVVVTLCLSGIIHV